MPHLHSLLASLLAHFLCQIPIVFRVRLCAPTYPLKRSKELYNVVRGMQEKLQRTPNVSISEPLICRNKSRTEAKHIWWKLHCVRLCSALHVSHCKILFTFSCACVCECRRVRVTWVCVYVYIIEHINYNRLWMVFWKWLQFKQCVMCWRYIRKCDPDCLAFFLALFFLFFTLVSLMLMLLPLPHANRWTFHLNIHIFSIV